MATNFHLIKSLTSPPIKRAAYSDRTAWLMAVMSSLAYVRFEQPMQLEALAGDLAKERDELRIAEKLRALLKGENRDQLKASLDSDLKSLGFELVNTYNVSIPRVVDTQAFLAKLTTEGRTPFLVLAFRGTEPSKAADIKSDVRALPTRIGPEDGKQMVHSGFYDAFRAVEQHICKDLGEPSEKDLPLYITGHSLGGALATVATHCLSSDYLSSDRLAACYTYGGPRVGNLAFGQSIKPPVYRVVNAADVVPRLPPVFFLEVLTLFIRWLSFLPFRVQFAEFLDKFRHYRHCGDLRYMTAADRKMAAQDQGDPPTYPGLKVIANPPQFSRWFWLWRRVISTRGSAAIADHDIKIYVEKLAHWGCERVSTNPTSPKGGSGTNTVSAAERAPNNPTSSKEG